MTRKNKVLAELRMALRGKVYYYGHPPTEIDSGYVPNYAIETVECGGLQGTRRLRELRRDGHNIIKKRHKNTGTFLYKLILSEENGQLKLMA